MKIKEILKNNKQELIDLKKKLTNINHGRR